MGMEIVNERERELLGDSFLDVILIVFVLTIIPEYLAQILFDFSQILLTFYLGELG